MKFEDYRKLTLRTNKWLGSDQFDLAHMLLGMCSELNELYIAIEKGDMINISEETADIMWYAANYCNIKKIETKNFYFKAIQIYNISDLMFYISELTDLAKKWIIYNKEIDSKKEKELLQAIIIACSSICEEQTFIKIEQALQNNIDKLRKRFPDKYSDEYAQNRDLEAERKELEK